MQYKKFVFEDVTEEMVRVCVESSLETLRISSLGNTFLKWNGEEPIELHGKGEEINNIDIELAKAEWQVEI